MDKAVEALIAEYDIRHAKELALIKTFDAEQMGQRRDEFLLPVGRHVAQLLNSIIRDTGAQVILEIGASYGYSTIWMAEAARETGGKVISLELSQNKIDFASDKLASVGLLEFVEYRQGDALKSLKDMTESPDLVLLDLWKDLYIRCFDLFYPKLADGAIVVADNMILPEWSLEKTQRYQQRVRSMHDMDSVLLPIGSGIEISRKTSN